MPVGQLLGQQPRRPSKLSAIARWRDWSITVKLAAVTLVPIVFAMVLGGITIANQVDRSNNYERIQRLVTLGGDVRTLTGALQEERTETASLLTQGTVGSSPQLDLARAAVDKALPQFDLDAGRAGQLDAAITDSVITVRGTMAKLADLRGQATTGKLEVSQALDDYTAMTSALLAMDNALVAEIGDGSIGSSPSALHGLQVAKENISFSQALLGYGISRGTLTGTQINDLRTMEVRLDDRIKDFKSAASPAQQQDFEHSVEGTDYDTRTRLVGTVLAAQNSGPALAAISGQQWSAASSSVIAAVDGVSNRLSAELTSTATGLVENSGTSTGLLAVLLFLALFVTGAVVFLITRQLLRSLRRLRAGAMDVADRQLPEAVRNIQDGQEQSTDVEPLAIGTTDEIGQVATAFDAVHSQALRLAAEQANLRTGYSSVFVNLSRRSQSLVQRQLQLIERLERDEEDADQLATLFQLDHLATRMRRNNENLMVLSGAEPGRRSGQPIATADVIRAAVSEIEQYQRVVVQQPPSARIVGYAASDLMRLIAELLDNATAFSAPETKVTVNTRVAEGGLLIDIVDKGIGMTETEITEANARLAQEATVDLATSRRMGLFVVGRLAGRHNIGVFLHGGKEVVGIRATVTVPGELVMDLQETGVIQAVPAEPATPQASEGLPQRRAVNGAVGAGSLSDFAGIPAAPGDGASAPGGWTNGHSGVLPSRKPGDVEISGTALFSPASDHPSLPSMPPVTPEPPPAPPAPPVSEPPSGPLPSGKALFEANDITPPSSGWWATEQQEPAPPEPPSLPETTPIFDETLSAWFRSDSPAPARPAETLAEPLSQSEPAGPPEPAEEPAAYEVQRAEDAAGEPEHTPASWAFAADESWRAVQSVSEAEPTSYTEAGLPRRRRGEQLLPGSATSEASVRPKRPARDPSDIRSRLSSFQKGVNRARHSAEPEAEAAPSSQLWQPPADSSQSSQPLPARPEPQSLPTRPEPQPVSDSSQPGPGKLPQRRPRPRPPREEEPAPASGYGQLPTRHPASGESTAYTPVERGLLPQHEQHEQYEPAASSSGTLPWPEPPEQTPAEEAGELTQRGVEPALPQYDQQYDQYDQQGQPAAFEPAASPSGESAWSFATDESWRTVETVSKTAPTSFTAAGLPRRRRGEQLLPGGASGPGGSRPQQRDPQDVRGRLASFQQGVQRGRHRTAHAVDSERENMEGE
ncbi:sensor histidine kinase [Amycolatopsis taiwanensis]|uniref:sensor histidine kinase n=1 Tax=Amycolatopsis taiwanensis TaxID=342230 RepID=UPI00048518DF|nr:nitrate- and nitrite sensing domain-containing protein [Amycolatopsis taiwanensis]